MSPETSLEQRVLDAAKVCCERWGRAKTTVDDIAAEARCSRATIYRLFPGGRDNLFEALRRAETENFFARLSEKLDAAVGFHDLVVTAVVEAARALAADEHLQLMLASEPGDVVHELTVDGLPTIVRVASEALTPWFAPHIGTERSPELAEWLSRIVISYFLAPSAALELTDPDSVARFAERFVFPAFEPQPLTTPTWR